MLTYGLSRSPTRAHFQNIPNTLFSSVQHLRESSFRNLPVLVAVHDSGHDRVRICARADDQEYHQQQ